VHLNDDFGLQRSVLTMDIFGWLSAHQWLAILRIAIGLWWIKSVLHKPLRRFLDHGMADWTLKLADNHPVPAFGRFMKTLIGKNRKWFPYLIVAGESAVGMGLTLGLLTPVSALVGIFMNLNYLFLAGARPKDRSVNPCFECEQGQNLTMIAAQLVIFMLGAWSVWSLDAALGIF
jgi:thiosulfate dehydrogenase [quinone] large subunit